MGISMRERVRILNEARTYADAGAVLGIGRRAAAAMAGRMRKAGWPVQPKPNGAGRNRIPTPDEVCDDCGGDVGGDCKACGGRGRKC